VDIGEINSRESSTVTEPFVLVEPQSGVNKLFAQEVLQWSLPYQKIRRQFRTTGEPQRHDLQTMTIYPTRRLILLNSKIDSRKKTL
jgi:hypothetical protein